MSMNELSQDFDCNFDNCMDKDGVRLRRRKDYIDGWVGGARPQVKVWLVMVVGSSGQQWALADVAAAGICWIRNWVRDQVPPGLYGGQDGHGIGRCRVGRRLCNKTLLFSVVLQLVFLCLPFSSYELVFCWTKKLWFAASSFKDSTNGILTSRTG